MLRDIGIAELGSVGNTVNAMVMYIEKPGVSYMLIPSDSTLLAQFDALSVPVNITLNIITNCYHAHAYAHSINDVLLLHILYHYSFFCCR